MSITAANGILMIACVQIGLIPTKIEGFGPDTAVTMDAIAQTVAEMGVDGRLSAGYTPVPRILNITLAADSPSAWVFDELYAAQEVLKDAFEVQVIMQFPSIGKQWSSARGFLTSAQPMPNMEQTLRPQTHQITCQEWTPAPLVIGA